jgi:ABC-type multidrug transport system fused ATPase/permease subunit
MQTNKNTAHLFVCFAVAGGERCAESLFKLMVSSLLRAPLSYFETTPLGRILNRFTYDVEVLDVELTVSLTGATITLSWFVASVIVMVRSDELHECNLQKRNLQKVSDSRCFCLLPR